MQGSNLIAGGAFNRRGNVGGRTGAGVHSAGQMTATNCEFWANDAFEFGGAITNLGDMTLVNCTLAANDAGGDGDGIHNDFGTLVMTGCVVWGNGPISFFGDTPTVTYSDVQFGFPGAGNIAVDPLFADIDAGDLRLQAGSPCIDAGDNNAFTVEAGQCSPTRTDHDGNPRFLADSCHGDTGNPDGTFDIVDMGPRELQGSSCDIGGDGIVGIEDLLLVLAGWGSCANCADCPGDFNGDCEVGIIDFLMLLANWG